MQCHGIHAVSLQLLMASSSSIMSLLIERQIQPERVHVICITLYDSYARANFYAKFRLILKYFSTQAAMHGSQCVTIL